MRKETFNKKHSTRKSFLMLAILAAMSLIPARVNSQIFLSDEDDASLRCGVDEIDFNLIVPYEGGDADQYLPLGDGLLLLGGLGVAYGLAKRKKSKR